MNIGKMNNMPAFKGVVETAIGNGKNKKLSFQKFNDKLIQSAPEISMNNCDSMTKEQEKSIASFLTDAKIDFSKIGKFVHYIKYPAGKAIFITGENGHIHFRNNELSEFHNLYKYV